jgi:5-phospho-D-xylono-1,4-lactonase
MTAASVVRTVLGDVPAIELGITYAHEHLVLDSALIATGFPHILLDDPAIAIAEVAACREAGVRSMVDAMPCSAGRGVVQLAAISSATGVNIVSATGLHHERYYGPHHWTTQVSVEELAQLFVDDLTLGIDQFDYTSPILRRTRHRAGIIKVATGGGRLNARDQRVFEAAAQAHATTGAPILTHCEHGRGALEQVAALVGLGVPADAILLSHIDKVTDLGYHRAIADTGAWSLFDQSLRQVGEETPATAMLIAHLAEHGHLDSIVLGTDGARRDLWTQYGGTPGLAALAAEFPSVLSRLGLAHEVAYELFVDNPARALAMRPPRASTDGSGA